MNRIIVRNLLDNDKATSPESAAPLFKELTKYLNSKEEVEVDFSDLSTITTAFFNVSIGDLYNNWTTEDLNNYIHIKANTLTELQRDKLRMVMYNAKTKLTDEELDN